MGARIQKNSARLSKVMLNSYLLYWIKNVNYDRTEEITEILESISRINNSFFSGGTTDDVEKITDEEYYKGSYTKDSDEIWKERRNLFSHKKTPGKIRKGSTLFFKNAAIDYCKAMSKFHRRCVLTTIINAMSNIGYFNSNTNEEETLLKRDINILKNSYVQMPQLNASSYYYVNGENNKMSSIVSSSSNTSRFSDKEHHDADNILSRPLFFKLIDSRWFTDLIHSDLCILELGNSNEFLAMNSNKIHKDLYEFMGFPLSIGEVGMNYISAIPSTKFLDSSETQLDVFKGIKTVDIKSRYTELSLHDFDLSRESFSNTSRSSSSSSSSNRDFYINTDRISYFDNNARNKKILYGIQIPRFDPSL